MAVNYNTSIVTNGLVLALDAANRKSYSGSGTTWTDLSGNNNSSSLQNSPAYNTGNQGYFTFNGTNQYSSFTSTSGFGVTNASPAASMSMWVNLSRKGGSGSSNYQSIAGFRNNSNADFYFLLLDSGGASVSTEARVRTTVSGYDINVPFLNYFQQWTHIVFVVNSTKSELYFNGLSVGSNTSISGNFGATSSFRIGNDFTSNAYWTSGNISNFLFYNRALLADEITKNFNAHRGRYGV